jgi:hypothetical protein
MMLSWTAGTRGTTASRSQRADGSRGMRTTLALVAGGVAAAKAIEFNHEVWRWVVAGPPLVVGTDRPEPLAHLRNDDGRRHAAPRQGGPSLGRQQAVRVRARGARGHGDRRLTVEEHRCLRQPHTRTAPERHGVNRRRHVRDRLGRVLSRGAAGAGGVGRRVLDRRASGDDGRVPAVRRDDGVPHAGRAPS